MSVNEIHIDAPPERVFDVLADPMSYEDWVVGSSDIRDVEGAWPTEGATFHHTQFVPHVGIKDTTTVLEERRPGYLCLCVRARPLVIGKVEMRLVADNGGTRAEMVETPVGGLVGKLHNPVFDAGLKARNAESLRRLKKLAER
jgi:uncharacterized protein YndB with AHSA1/START domain